MYACSTVNRLEGTFKLYLFFLVYWIYEEYMQCDSISFEQNMFTKTFFLLILY